MDPAHVPYAHKGLMGKFCKKEDLGRVEFDIEGGGPIKMKTKEANVDGFLTEQQENRGYFRYVAPCTFYGSPLPREVAPFAVDDSPLPSEATEEEKKKKPQFMMVFMCIPVAPGKSRVIWALPRNVGVWLDKVIPRWYYHMGPNALFDSDMYLLHVEERNFAAAGVENWHKAVYVPTSSDNMVIAFRNWFRKHCKSQVGWAVPTADQLPVTPTKDKLMERVLVARGAVQELQRGVEGHEGAGGRPAVRVGCGRRVPRRRQGDAGDVGRAESRRRVLGRAVLRGVPLAGELHPEELLFP
ncbi:unnamed protein product [Triticum turgidum subsp. durum]|uniref:Pheophorbide a oxygenase domain-containing protein n=1 Tax=Triticum turgidum subsp. durum TaxID=4567 RepID=A0A9R0WTT5_TRITD|nr:unnamed protein product [Triticum turgidum subsp. durum]